MMGCWIEICRRQPLHQFCISTAGEKAVRIVAADAAERVEKDSHTLKIVGRIGRDRDGKPCPRLTLDLEGGDCVAVAPPEFDSSLMRKGDAEVVKPFVSDAFEQGVDLVYSLGAPDHTGLLGSVLERLGIREEKLSDVSGVYDFDLRWAIGRPSLVEKVADEGVYVAHADQSGTIPPDESSPSRNRKRP